MLCNKGELSLSCLVRCNGQSTRHDRHCGNDRAEPRSKKDRSGSQGYLAYLVHDNGLRYNCSGFVELGFAIGILDGVICKIGLSLIFVSVFSMEYTGYFLGIGCSRILPGILCFVYFLSGRWKTRKLLL